MVPASSISTGAVKPNCRILAAICRICFVEWVRAFRAHGVSVANGRCVICGSDITTSWMCSVNHIVPQDRRKSMETIRRIVSIDDAASAGKGFCAWAAASIPTGGAARPSNTGHGSRGLSSRHPQCT